MKRRNKRYRKKYRKTRVPKAMFATGGNFVSPRLFTKLKYAELFAPVVAATTLNEQVFRINSLFDPDLTGVGHQPMGFDQLAVLYNRYRVYKATWKIVSPCSNDVFYVGALPANGSWTGTTWQEFMEQPNSRYKAVGAGGTPTIYISGGAHLATLGGETTSEYGADDRFQALVTASPSEVMLLYVLHYNPTGSSITMRYNIQITYYVEFYDPKLISGS